MHPDRLDHPNLTELGLDHKLHHTNGGALDNPPRVVGEICAAMAGQAAELALN